MRTAKLRNKCRNCGMTREQIARALITRALINKIAFSAPDNYESFCDIFGVPHQMVMGRSESSGRLNSLGQFFPEAVLRLEYERLHEKTKIEQDSKQNSLNS